MCWVFANNVQWGKQCDAMTVSNKHAVTVNTIVFYAYYTIKNI